MVPTWPASLVTQLTFAMGRVTLPETEQFPQKQKDFSV